MQKLLLAASAAALALGAAPAFAQDAGNFTGARVGVSIGTGGNKVVDFDDQTIGIEAGYDFDAGDVVVGLGAEYRTEFGKDFFDVNETALLGRVGVKAGTNALVYGTGGYTRVSTGATPFGSNGDDGYRLGAGVEFGGPVSFKVEQRYSDYGNGVDGWQTVAGVNFRF